MAHYKRYIVERGTSAIKATELIALDGRDIILQQGHDTPSGVYTVAVHTQVVEPTRLYAGSIVYANEFMDWLMGEMQSALADHKAFIYEEAMPLRCRVNRYKDFWEHAEDLQYYIENVLPTLDSGKEPEEEANFDF